MKELYLLDLIRELEDAVEDHPQRSVFIQGYDAVLAMAADAAASFRSLEKLTPSALKAGTAREYIHSRVKAPGNAQDAALALALRILELDDGFDANTARTPLTALIKTSSLTSMRDLTKSLVLSSAAQLVKKAKDLAESSTLDSAALTDTAAALLRCLDALPAPVDRPQLASPYQNMSSTNGSGAGGKGGKGKGRGKAGGVGGSFTVGDNDDGPGLGVEDSVRVGEVDESGKGVMAVGLKGAGGRDVSDVTARGPAGHATACKEGEEGGAGGKDSTGGARRGSSKSSWADVLKATVSGAEGEGKGTAGGSRSGSAAGSTGAAKRPLPRALDMISRGGDEAGAVLGSPWYSRTPLAGAGGSVDGETASRRRSASAASSSSSSSSSSSTSTSSSSSTSSPTRAAAAGAAESKKEVKGGSVVGGGSANTTPSQSSIRVRGKKKVRREREKDRVRAKEMEDALARAAAETTVGKDGQAKAKGAGGGGKGAKKGGLKKGGKPSGGPVEMEDAMARAGVEGGGGSSPLRVVEGQGDLGANLAARAASGASGRKGGSGSAESSPVSVLGVDAGVADQAKGAKGARGEMTSPECSEAVDRWAGEGGPVGGTPHPQNGAGLGGGKGVTSPTPAGGKRGGECSGRGEGGGECGEAVSRWADEGGPVGSTPHPQNGAGVVGAKRGGEGPEGRVCAGKATTPSCEQQRERWAGEGGAMSPDEHGDAEQAGGGGRGKGGESVGKGGKKKGKGRKARGGAGGGDEDKEREDEEGADAEIAQVTGRTTALTDSETKLKSLKEITTVSADDLIDRCGGDVLIAEMQGRREHMDALAVGEALMKDLFRLDELTGLTAAGRAARKEAVRSVQRLLSEADEVAQVLGKRREELERRGKEERLAMASSSPAKGEDDSGESGEADGQGAEGVAQQAEAAARQHPVTSPERADARARAGAEAGPQRCMDGPGTCRGYVKDDEWQQSLREEKMRRQGQADHQQRQTQQGGDDAQRLDAEGSSPGADLRAQPRGDTSALTAAQAAEVQREVERVVSIVQRTPVSEWLPPAKLWSKCVATIPFRTQNMTGSWIALAHAPGLRARDIKMEVEEVEGQQMVTVSFVRRPTPKDVALASPAVLSTLRDAIINAAAVDINRGACAHMAGATNSRCPFTAEGLTQGVLHAAVLESLRGRFGLVKATVALPAAADAEALEASYEGETIIVRAPWRMRGSGGMGGGGGLFGPHGRGGGMDSLFGGRMGNGQRGGGSLFGGGDPFGGLFGRGGLF